MSTFHVWEEVSPPQGIPRGWYASDGVVLYGPYPTKQALIDALSISNSNNVVVDFIDCMGSDLTVVNAARVSFNKHKDVLSEQDVRLIHYLANHNHWTPFAHCFATFRVKAPIFVARQLAKHQVGFVWNEVSRRYVTDAPEFYLPAVWRSRPVGSLKQGSGDPLNKSFSDTVEAFYTSATELYQMLLGEGVAPEQARMVLPQSTMTEWYWSGSLAAFARVCKQRLDAHAQKETAEVARQLSDYMAKLFPVSWKALMGALNA